MVAAALARRQPKARLVITGRDTDHPTVSAWLSDMGLDQNRISYEPEARNTFEDAALCGDTPCTPPSR